MVDSINSVNNINRAIFQNVESAQRTERLNSVINFNSGTQNGNGDPSDMSTVDLLQYCYDGLNTGTRQEKRAFKIALTDYICEQLKLQTRENEDGLIVPKYSAKLCKKLADDIITNINSGNLMAAFINHAHIEEIEDTRNFILEGVRINSNLKNPYTTMELSLDLQDVQSTLNAYKILLDSPDLLKNFVQAQEK